MTYDQWFKSQQGIAYEGQYMFAEAAWVHQLTRIIDQQDTIKQLQKDLAEREAEIVVLKGTLDMWLLSTIKDRGDYAAERSFTREALSTPPSTRYLEMWERERYGEPVGQYVGNNYLGDDCIFLYDDKTLRVPTPLYARKD